MKYPVLQAKRWMAGLGLAITAVLLAGCPPEGTDPDAEYDLGYAAGFLRDDYYWQGFYDSYDTVDGGTIYYAGADIPIYDDPPYDAGYWDGVWYAYNDGYFVEYDYAFAIGFSEGYDVAFQPGYASYLANDTHFEYLDGGFTDGYNDGFSEGRVFGAYDWANNLDFDWLDALLDYQEGTDLTVAGVSTGANGPVELYIYGTDPNELIKGISTNNRDPGPNVPSIRKADKQAGGDISYRPLDAGAVSDFSVRPGTSPRSAATLRVEGQWIDRINEYRAASGNTQ